MAKWLASLAILIGAFPVSAVAAEWPNGARAAVVLTYDDAAPSQLDHAIPALDAAGLKGTFFLSNVRLHDVERWRAAGAGGHELANHTLTHPCLARTYDMPLRQQLEQHTPESVLQDISQQNVLLTALDGRRDHGFAVPCGQTLAGGKDYLEPLRQSGLVTYSRGVDQTDAELARDPLSLDLMKLPGRAFAAPDDAQRMIDFVELAAKKGGLAVFVFHGVGGDHLSVSAEDHRQLVEWLAANRQTYWIAPMRDVVKWIADQKAKSAPASNKKEYAAGAKGERGKQQE